ncbi:hypothetical protein D3C85_783720 [compost metagenome]
MLTLGDRLEQGRAQRRGQGQGEERREQDRGGHRQRELLVDHAHRALHERHRDKHRHQHQGDADDGPGDLAHGFARSLLGRQALGGHDPLDVLHHDDGVVHQDADGQHHAEHGQHVDRETQRQHGGEGAHQCHRHHQGRDQRIADVLQEQEHHREHQHHGFAEGHHHLGDRDFDERRGVVRDLVFHAGREVARQLVHFLAHQGCGVQRVGTGCQLYADRGRRFAIKAGGELVFLAADLDPRHIAHPHGGAVGVGPQDNVSELFGRRQLTLDQDGGGDFLGGTGRQVADAAGRDLGVLRDNRGVDVGRGQVETDQFPRVEPNTHRPLGAVQRGLADAVQALDLVHHVTRQVITERHVVELAVAGGESDQQQEAGRDLLDRQTLLDHRLRQARLHRLEAVLHIDLGHFRVGAGLEGGGDGGAAEAALGFEIQQVIGAVEFLFDQADHAFIDRLRRGAGVYRVNLDLRRCDVGVLRHRQLRDGQGTGQQDKQCNHPGEHRAVDKEVRHKVCVLPTARRPGQGEEGCRRSLLARRDGRAAGLR